MNTPLNPYLSIPHDEGIHGNTGRKYKTRSVKKMMFALLRCLELFAQRRWVAPAALVTKINIAHKRRFIYLYKRHHEDITPIQEPTVAISYKYQECTCGQIFYMEEIPNHNCTKQNHAA